MIQWLSDWLQQIVILVLIATFMDLLLPNNGLERYVKLVMGLLIILAMLTPVFDLLDKEWDFSLLEGLESETAMTPVDQVQSEGESLAASREQLVQEQVEHQLGQQMGSDVENRFRVNVAHTETKTTRVEEGQEFRIEQVQMTVRRSPDPGNEAADPVAEVEHVIIDWEQRPHSRATTVSQEGKRLGDEIAAFVAENWDVTADKVQVTVEEGS